MRALLAGTTPKKVFDIAGEIKRVHDVPVIVMTYYNIVYQMGVEAFCSTAEKNGVNGVITPDLPVEEATLYKEIAMRYGLDTIFLAAQSTSEARLERLLHASLRFLVPYFSKWRYRGAQHIRRRKHRVHKKNRH